MNLVIDRDRLVQIFGGERFKKQQAVNRTTGTIIRDPNLAYDHDQSYLLRGKMLGVLLRDARINADRKIERGPRDEERLPRPTAVRPATGKIGQAEEHERLGRDAAAAGADVIVAVGPWIGTLWNGSPIADIERRFSTVVSFATVCMAFSRSIERSGGAAACFRSSGQP